MTKATKKTQAQQVTNIGNPGATQHDAKIKQLVADLKGLNVTSEVESEVVAIALDIGGIGGRGLTASDAAQLRDLAVVSMRINSVAPRLDGIFETDPKLYCQVLSKHQNDSTIRRGLLRDLKATRLSRGASRDESEDVTAWTGVV
jgi:hypothetical protein